MKFPFYPIKTFNLFHTFSNFLNETCYIFQFYKIKYLSRVLQEDEVFTYICASRSIYRIFANYLQMKHCTLAILPVHNFAISVKN